MDSRLRQRMRDMPTKQDPHASETNTDLPHTHRGTYPAIPMRSHGPHYWATSPTREGRYPHHSGPGLLSRSHIFAMLYHDHGARDSPTLSGPHIPMVRFAQKDHQRPRSPIHFPLRKGPNGETRDPAEPVHRIPPTD